VIYNNSLFESALSYLCQPLSETPLIFTKIIVAASAISQNLLMWYQ
jgi:hypothetical protein